MKVHMSFTKEQKKQLQGYPPLPVRRVVDDKELSIYMNELATKIEAETKTKKSKSEKLIYDLHDKDTYCVYSVFLKYLLENNHNGSDPRQNR